MDQLEQKLGQISEDIKTFAAQAVEQQKNIGAVAAETKTALDTLKTEMHEKFNALEESSKEQQIQLDALDKSIKAGPVAGGNGSFKTIGQQITESDGYLAAKSNDFRGISRQAPLTIHLKQGSAYIEKKDVTLAGLGNPTSGVVNHVRLPGIVDLPMQELRVRDVMRVIPQTEGNSFDYVYQNTRTNLASPQHEGGAKAESTYNWASASGQIRTIAHFVDVSRQALDDVNWLRAKIDSELVYGLKIKEEDEILAGDGLGQHLAGIIPAASAFDTNLLVAAAGWTRLDILRLAKLQCRLAGLATYPPTAYVLHPTDAARLELTKDDNKNYIMGDPRTGQEVKFVWNLPVVESDSMDASQFLVGAFANGAEIRDRQAVSVSISFENGTNFTSNMATILCEERIGLAITKADSFVRGIFSTSPASQN